MNRIIKEGDALFNVVICHFHHFLNDIQDEK